MAPLCLGSATAWADEWVFQFGGPKYCQGRTVLFVTNPIRIVGTEPIRRATQNFRETVAIACGVALSPGGTSFDVSTSVRFTSEQAARKAAEERGDTARYQDVRRITVVAY